MILWGHEHQERAQSFATTYHESSAALSGLSRGSHGIEPITCGDSTLSIWGHGGPERFAEMLDVECGLLINNWKSRNPGLKTVELITCDAQHHLIPLAGFARRVLAFTTDKQANIEIKAMPFGRHADDRSILWASAGTSTFCYITAHSQETFDHANQRLQTLAATKGNNLAVTAADLAQERTLVPPNNYTINGGAFNVLRATLSTVHSALEARG
jgi:hypothetical protein